MDDLDGCNSLFGGVRRADRTTTRPDRSGVARRAPKKEPSPTVAPIDTAQPAATPTIEAVRYRADLPDLGVAPELNNEVWLNTDQPVRLADVRGKVIVLDMWTFGCINCRNVIP